MLYFSFSNYLIKLLRYCLIRKVQTSVAFKNLQSFPSNDPDIRDLKIMVDKKHESVIIPIFGK